MESDLHSSSYDTTSMEEHKWNEDVTMAVAMLGHNNHDGTAVGVAHIIQPVDEERKTKRKKDEDEDDEEEEESGSEEQLASGGPLVDITSQEDKASAIRKQATNWISKFFQHNFAPNYTGISKDFVYQLYHHSFAAEAALMSVPQFTRLFNEVMYKDIEFNPRARKTPSNSVIGELFPLLGVSLEVVEKTFGHKDKRITYFPKVSLIPSVKELKDCLVTGNWDQQRFLESLRNYKRLTTESKESRKPAKRQNLDPTVAATIIPQYLSDHRIYANDKYMVVALDIPGVDPNEIEISFPTDKSIRVTHKEGTKTYEENVLLDSGQFSIVGESMRRGNILSIPREIQLPDPIEVPHPSNTSSPFIHDHYGTVLFKFLRKFQQEEPYLKSFWSKDPLKFE